MRTTRKNPFKGIACGDRRLTSNRWLRNGLPCGRVRIAAHDTRRRHNEQRRDAEAVEAFDKAQCATNPE